MVRSIQATVARMVIKIKPKTPKGQLITKCLFGIFNPPKKTDEKGQPYYSGTPIKLFRSFLGELKTPKKTLGN